MLSLVASLASQIGFLIASLNKSNYKSVVYELSLLTEYGATEILILLRNCLEQVNLRDGDMQNLHLKLELLAIIIRHLVHQPNFSTILSEAVTHTPFSEDLLEDLSKALKLSLLEQIGLGLALTDAENSNWRHEGHNFCEVKIIELCQTPITGASETIIDQILLFLYESEGLSKHVPAFVKILPVLQPEAHTSLLLMPLLCEKVNEIDCVRDIGNSSPGIAVPTDVMQQLDNATEIADVMEELGYSCTIDVPHCNEILSLFSPLNENGISRIIGMVSRTYTGLEDCQGIHATFNTAFCNNTFGDGSWSMTWNVDVLLKSIKELVPSINWASVVENLDHEGFYLPDQKAFNLLMAIYGKACQDPFPIEAVCGAVWKNVEGQLSILRYAVLAPPEVFTFARSPMHQTPLEDQHGHQLPYGNQNQAWLSLDLLEILCKLAEMGHASTVRSILDYPLKHCPETLLLGLVQINITWTMMQHEIFASLFPIYLNGHQHSSIVLHELWVRNPEIMMRGMVEVQSSDASSISKILDVCQDFKALSTVLDATPFSFSIELAVLASRREYLNFEKWLHDSLNIHRDVFFQACLKFLRERALAEPRTDISGGTGQRLGPIGSLPLETTATLFKVLQANSGLVTSRDLLEEMKRVHAATVRVNPRLLSVGASEQSPSESFASDIEEEANTYFQRIYVGQLTIDNVVSMLERFKESSVKREQEIFACMIQSLFDEYRFFPRYPERELKITAVLFGSLIKHQLVSSLTLGVALRYVLDALRKPLDSKMFLFGLTALGKFLDRLVEWPQYCNHILQISHMREAHGDLVDFIDHALARISASQAEQSGATIEQHHNVIGQISSSSTSIIETVEVSEGLSKSLLGGTDTPLGQQQQHIQLSQTDSSEEKSKSMLASSVFLKSPSLVLSASMQHSSSNPLFDSGSGQKANQANLTTLPSFLRSSRLPGIQGILPRQPTSMTGFGHALNIETLVAAAERRVIPIEAPSSDVQDKIAFIINNISTANTDAKAREFLEVLREQYYPWFAQYMVMKRASIEPNFHESYLKFLDKINSKALHKEIVKATYENCKVLLGSELIKSSSEERSLLKNLGSWLGKLTIGRNQALRAREIDPKLLIIEAYEKGLMIAVIPFTSKILEPCQSSLAYQPPNPWTMGILGLLAEIYALPNLKMNLKFDIEVLFKNLGVDMKDVKPTQLLKGRLREIEGNPDFSNKDLAMAHQSLAAAAATENNSASLGQVDLFSEASVSPTRPAIPHTTQVSQLVPSMHLSSSLVQLEEDKVAALASTERLPTPQGLSQSTSSPSPYSNNQLSMAIPNLSTYVVVNSKLAPLGQQLQLSRIVPLAMERAIREIISPVVDRSVTIACMTTRELVTKDYAMEADENRIRHSANLMVASLAGSLAHVTCKEPLRVAMANHLRNLLQALNVSGEVLEQAVLLVTNDNLDLGCAVIEKAATEKALRDLEEAIGSALTVRRKQREAVGAGFYDVTVYNQGNLSRLPDALRPKPGRLSNSQQRVYEDFARLPWQNQPTQSTAAAPGALTGPSNAPVVSGLGRVGYTPPVGQGLSSYSGGGGVQSAIGIGTMAQPADVSSDELDHRLPSPLSLSSSGSVVLVDGGARHILETAAGLGNFAAGGGANVEVARSEALPATKDAVTLTGSASPPLPLEQLGDSGTEPALTTGEVMEKYQVLMQKVDAAISKGLSLGYTSPSQDQEIKALVLEMPEILTQCISKDEAALAVAQKVFKRLYEDPSNTLHVATHLALLATIRDVCKRVVKELTSLVIYSDDERQLNREITLGLIRYELIHLSEYNLHLAKLMDGGRNTAAVEFAVYLVQTCVVQDAGVNAAELYNVIDALGKVAQRPGSPESLQQLLEIAKNTSTATSEQTAGGITKDDKTRQLKDNRPASRGGVTREDTKIANRDPSTVDPVGFREQVAMLFDEWARVCDAPGANDKGYAVYISQLQHSGMLKGDDVSDRFFRILLELAVTHSINSENSVPSSITVTALQQQGISFTAIDMYAKLVVLLVKYYAVDPAMSKVNLLNRVLSVSVRVIQRDSDENRTNFHPRPYFRLFVTWLTEFNSPDPALDGSNFQVLTAFANVFMQLQPLRVPGWSFAWLELVSNRMFMPKVLLSNAQKGWPLMQRLLVALFKFMEPYLRNADLSDPVRLLYKGTLRVLLVLLHDFPEFLCDYHFSFCDVIPPSCIQMRNLILSAFPRNMRLPDPFTPNLKVDLLPEISQSPRILSEVDFSLKNKQLKSEVDDYLKTRQPLSMLLVDLKQRLMLPQHEAVSAGTRYNVPLINSLVLYVGMQAIQQLQSKTSPQQLAVPTAPITHSAPMDIFQRLIVELDTEGRYLFLNAVANQLRYPNNHTHYFSCVLLYLFAEANQEIIQEQITRVLLERLIVNRPHPWGLLITFIELIKNPRYNFWSHGFTRCAPEIEKLFESVARSCMGPPLKPAEDDLSSTMAVEGLKT